MLNEHILHRNSIGQIKLMIELSEHSLVDKSYLLYSNLLSRRLLKHCKLFSFFYEKTI